MRFLGRMASGAAALFLLALPACSSKPGESANVRTVSKQEAQQLALSTSKPVLLEPRGDRELASANLLGNGSFEETAEEGAIPSWTGPKDAMTLDGDAMDGDQCLRVAVKAEPIVISQPIPAVRGAKYWLRAHLRCENLTGTAKLAVESAQNPALFSESATNSVTGTAPWTPVSFEFETPLDEFTVQLMVTPTGEGGGTVWLDDAELFQLAAPAVVNLLTNASFEANPDPAAGWSVQNNIKVARSTDAVDGNASLEVTTDNKTTVYVNQRVSVVPGGTYVMDGMVKTENVAGPVWLEVRDGQRGDKGFIHTGEAITGTTDWTHLEMTFTVPATTRSLFVYLRRPAPKAENQNNEEAHIWFDAYRLRKVDKAGQ